MTPALAIQLTLFSPCVGAVLVLLFGRWQNVRDTISILAGIATLYFVIRIAGYHADEARLALEVVDVMPGLTLAFEVEPLGLVYALVAAGLVREHGEAPQPREQLVAVVRVVQRLQRVAFSRPDARAGQQRVDLVVAQDAAPADISPQPERRERVRAAVDQVTEAP